MAEPPHINITADNEHPDDDVLRILKEIRPNWSEKDITLELVGGGFINKTIKILHNNNSDDGIILRINGTVGEKIGISRTNEVEYLKLWNRNDLGVPLVASFNNGIVSKLSSGKPLDNEQSVALMTDPNFVRKITRILAKMHRLPIAKNRTVLKRQDNRMMILAMNSLKELKQIENHEGLKKFNEIVTWDDMESELNWIYSETEKFQMPVCLCHNDLWHANILYDEKNDSINVIDLEMTDFNFAPYDIASYLVMLMRNHLISGLPVAKEVGPEFSNFFIRSYLEGLAELERKTLSSVTKEDVEKYHKWTNVCTLLYLLTYTPVMMYITYYQCEYGQFSGREGNCVQFGQLWFKEYRLLKEEYQKN